MLNNSNGILGIYNHTKGGGSATVIDTRIIFSTALACNASALIVAHNHPSSSLKPSSADINITNKLKQAAELFDIRLLDHIIITNNGYYSFSDEGLV